MRSEIGLTQSELANELNVGFSAVSRWENKNARPNRASSMAILELAKRRGVSSICLDTLSSILLASRADSKAGSDRLERITERMTLEQRVLLTSGQMKATIDNLDLAVIVQRIYSVRSGKLKVHYHNRRYAEIFGYSETEFAKKNDENPYFALPQESVDAYLEKLRLLCSGELELGKFILVLRAVKKGGDTIWVEVKGLSLTQYSYGYELFLSCQDVTPRIEAERKYAEEVAVREASFQGFFASAHCDLTANTVFRHRGIELVTGREFAEGSVDDMIGMLAAAMLDEGVRAAFLRDFNRKALLAAHDKNDTFRMMRAFNTVARRWLRTDFVLMQNPYTGHTEAGVYVNDIQSQTLPTSLMKIFADRFFEYIGIIDAENEKFEAYYYSERTFGHTVDGKRDYPAVCAEKLRLYASPEEYAAQSEAISLSTVRSRLSAARFYSTVLRLRGYDGEFKPKKITYTYLDDTRTMIVVSQSDMTNVEQIVREYHASIMEKRQC